MIVIDIVNLIKYKKKYINKKKFYEKILQQQILIIQMKKIIAMIVTKASNDINLPIIFFFINIKSLKQ